MFPSEGEGRGRKRKREGGRMEMPALRNIVITIRVIEQQNNGLFPKAYGSTLPWGLFALTTLTLYVKHLTR